MADHYQRIGGAALAACPEAVEKLLLYAEVEDGVSSADLFFQLHGESVVRFRFAPSELRDLVVEFWETGEGPAGPGSWAAFSFVVEGGQFSVNLIYPEQFVADEGLAERRPRAIAACFPGMAVDYSRPSGQ